MKITKNPNTIIIVTETPETPTEITTPTITNNNNNLN